MNIEKKHIRYNHSNRIGTKIRYIVIHDTGNTRPGANAFNRYRYFNGGNRRASAHYFVDDERVIETVPIERSAWHVGDGRGRYGITNSNSVGIEICVNADGNYEKAVENAVSLTQTLLEKLHLTKEAVVRHYDASRKLCPHSMSWNGWEKWWEFKEKI